MLLTPTKVARGALLRFCRICERREGPGSGLGIVRRLERARVDGSDTLVRRRSRRSTAGNR